MEKIFLMFLLVILLLGCTTRNQLDTPPEYPEIEIGSSFGQMDFIPKKFTCEGENTNPVLAFREVPTGTMFLAVIVRDLDSGKNEFFHWMAWNIPASSQIPEHAERIEGILQAKNDFGSIGYRGPCPPKGSVHRYVYEVYFLS